VIQRVRTRWGADARGASAANLRGGLDAPVALPTLLAGATVVVHEVLADQATGYRRHEEVFTGGLDQAHPVGLGLALDGDAVLVDRLPVFAAYPIRRAPQRLFPLLPRQTGRYQANFRFTGCACNPQWYYERWTIHVGHTLTRPAPVDLFTPAQLAHDVDDRVHLYGGPRRARRHTERLPPGQQPTDSTPHTRQIRML
jgi:hypothetical protein